ncbi:hypothetical protein [Stappia sp. MMSF_3263]|nr:hypothetical protein [Stappia sp. MMSF_3263]
MDDIGACRTAEPPCEVPAVGVAEANIATEEIDKARIVFDS